MSLRFLFMMIYAPTACAVALWRPFYGILALVAMYYFRPDIWSMPTWFRPVMWITVASFVGWLLHAREVRFSNITGLAILCVFAMIISSMTAVNSSQVSFSTTESIFKMIVVQFLILQLCDTLPKVNLFLWSNVLGMIWNVKSVLVVGIGGGNIGDRVNIGVAQGGGANYLAMVFAMSIPLFHAKFLNGNKWEKLYSMAMFPLYMLCIVLTGSRGGILSAATSAGWVTLRGNKKVVGILLALVGAGVLLFFMPEEMKDRFIKGVKPEEGNERDFAAQSRLDLWGAGWKMFKARPIQGVGQDNYQALSPEYVGYFSKGGGEWAPGKVGKGFVCHSTWFQTLAEGGLLLAVPFFGIFFVVYYKLGRIKRMSLGPPEIKREFVMYAVILQALFGAFIVASTFGSHIKVDFMWWYFGSVSALHTIALRREQRLHRSAQQAVRQARSEVYREPVAPPAY